MCNGKHAYCHQLDAILFLYKILFNLAEMQTRKCPNRKLKIFNAPFCSSGHLGITLISGCIQL